MLFATVLLLGAGPALQSELSEEAVSARILERLSTDFAALEPERRGEIAATYARGILQNSAFGHDRARMLACVDSRLAGGADLSRKIAGVSQAAARSVERWVPDARRTMSLPESFADRERDALLAMTRHYIFEILARPRATDGEIAALRQQLSAIQAELRALARTKIFGAYADPLIEKTLEMTRAQLEEQLGDPLAAALARPLTADELARVIEAAREDVAGMAPVEASTDADLEYSRTGVAESDAETAAIRLANRLALRMFSTGELQYPSFATANAQYQRVFADAQIWHSEAWARIEQELDAEKERSKEIASLIAQGKIKPLKPSVPTPLKLPAGPAASGSPAATERPDGTPSTGRLRFAGAALLVVLLALTAGWGIRRRSLARRNLLPGPGGRNSIDRTPANF